MRPTCAPRKQSLRARRAEAQCQRTPRVRLAGTCPSTSTKSVRGGMGAEVAQTTCCETQLGLDGISNDSGTVRWEIPEPADQSGLFLHCSSFLEPRPRLFLLSWMACPVTTASVIGFIASQGGSGDYTISTSWHPSSGKGLRSWVSEDRAEAVSGHNDEFWSPHSPPWQHTNEKFKKGGAAKLSHWKHDSTPSDRKLRPASPGDLHRSPEEHQTHGLTAWTLASGVKNPRGGQDRSTLRTTRSERSDLECLVWWSLRQPASKRQLSQMIRTSYEVSLENGLTTPLPSSVFTGAGFARSSLP